MCDFGGMNGGGFSTPFNTIGIGDPTPVGTDNIGSGDIYASLNKKPAKKKEVNYGEQLPYIVKAKG